VLLAALSITKCLSVKCDLKQYVSLMSYVLKIIFKHIMTKIIHRM